LKYATPSAFRAALEQRLLNISHRAGLSLVRLRKMVVFDRLLARLLVAAPNRWVLKGALALEFRLGTRSRTTKDMDLVRQDGQEATTADFLLAQSVDLGDFFAFAIERTGKLDEVPEGAAVRYHVRVELAGRPFEDVIVDVAFGDPASAPPDLLCGSDLLAFAGIAPVEVPALPLEQHVAEKVHAYSRVYSGGRQSSRVKDLVDLVLIRSSARLEVGRLQYALKVVFESRATHPLPKEIPFPPSAWATAYRRLAREVGLNPDMREGHQLAADFLNPVLGETLPENPKWDPSAGSWHSRGPQG
jgi:hypothetical protein